MEVSRNFHIFVLWGGGGIWEGFCRGAAGGLPRRGRAGREGGGGEDGADDGGSG